MPEPSEFSDAIDRLREQKDYVPPAKRGPKPKASSKKAPAKKNRIENSSDIHRRILKRAEDKVGRPDSPPRPPMEAITDRDLDAYTPPEQLIRLARMLILKGGDHRKTLEAMGWSVEEYTEFLGSDSYRLAWLSRYCHRQLEHMLGLLDMAMFEKASHGDVQAYKALMDRYGKIISRSMSVAIQQKLPGTAGQSKEELQKFTPEQLEALVSEKIRRLGLTHDPKEG